jgi:FeS assembly protein IscX
MPKLTWENAEDIGLALYEKFPSIDPLTVRFTDLHQWVTQLEDFAGEAAGSSEAKLEAIQMAWREEWEEAQP